MRPMATLVAAVAAISAFFIAHSAVRPSSSETAQLLTSLGLTFAFVLWMIADARSRHQIPCYDFGFLAGVFFPASLVWYVLWTRRRRGLLTLAGLIGLMFLPWISAAVVWTVTHSGA